MVAALAVAQLMLAPLAAQAGDPLLAETVEFNGAVLYRTLKTPALVLGVVRNGQIAVAGFGEIADGSKREPNGDTVMRIGSITKAFTGEVLASLVADKTVRLTDRLDKHLKWGVPVPERDGRPIRLIDLATQTSGLPREPQREPGPPEDPFKTLTNKTLADALRTTPLLFAPGSGALYSNFGFYLLAAALASANGGQPYEALLRQRVLGPAKLTATSYAVTEAQKPNLMQGHDFDRSPLPDVPTGPADFGAGGLYSTPNDILRWLAWHMDRFSPADAETRLLSQTPFVSRDGLKPVSGLDESGEMSAMSLGWVVMAPRGDRPLILQKAGGLQGIFSYAAFAPTRGVGVFVAVNQFDFAAAMAMARAANDLIADLAPR